MKNFFVPYIGDKPAYTVINGHRLLIVSQDREEMLEHLESFGGDRVETFHADDQEDELLETLAENVNGGVVVAPSDLGLEDVLRSLQDELPWIQ